MATLYTCSCGGKGWIIPGYCIQCLSCGREYALSPYRMNAKDWNKAQRVKESPEKVKL